MSSETKWSIDLSHSEVSFMIRHLMITHVKGTFKIFDADITTTDKDFTTAVIDFSIEASSISTGNLKRDEHLIGGEFFDVQKHRQIQFRSSTISPADTNGNHELWGELTIKGITKAVKLSAQFGGIAKDPWGNEKAGFTVSGIIKRSDWGLSWNTALETGGFMLSDDVTIACEMELINSSLKASGSEPVAKPTLKETV